MDGWLNDNITALCNSNDNVVSEKQIETFYNRVYLFINNKEVYMKYILKQCRIPTVFHSIESQPFPNYT